MVWELKMAACELQLFHIAYLDRRQPRRNFPELGHGTPARIASLHPWSSMRASIWELLESPAGGGGAGSYCGLPCWPLFSEVFLKTLAWYSVMEATFGVGYTLGPVLRAFLYQAGGQYGPHHRGEGWLESLLSLYFTHQFSLSLSAL